MRIITRLVKPHIRFHKSGLIEILSPAAKIIGLRNYDSISNVTNNVYRLPDIKGKDLFKPSLSFRLGATENERTPIITRRIIEPDQ